MAPVPLVGDFAGGSLYLVVGVLSALIARGTTGRGQVVDAAMVDGAAHLFSMVHGLLGAGRLARRARGQPARRWRTVLRGLRVRRRPVRGRGGTRAAVLGRARVRPRGRRSTGEQYDADTWPAQREAFAAAFRTRIRDEWAAHFEGDRRLRRAGAVAPRGAAPPAPCRPGHLRPRRARPPRAATGTAALGRHRRSTRGPSRCPAPTRRPTCWPTGSPRRRSPTSSRRARSSQA